MKSTQELETAGFVPSCYIEKEIWDELKVEEKSALIANRVIKEEEEKEFVIFETPQYIIFFTKS